MSEAVLTGPIPSFVDERIPFEVERGARGGPGFNTTVTLLSSGFEQRNADWVLARAQYNIGFGVTTKQLYEDILDFFFARHGRLVGFRFRDWSDYELENGEIGVGDGVRTQFQIVKLYGIGEGSFYIRPIQKISTGASPDFFRDPVITLNDVAQVEGTDFTLDVNTGVLTFTNPPPSGAVVRATLDFDVPVRFDTDEIDVVLNWEDAGFIPALPIIELRIPLEELNA